MKRFMKDFRAEMKRGLSGRPSSLKMLSAYAERPKGTEEGAFLAIDLGGTNFRVAALELKGDRKVRGFVSEEFALKKEHIAYTGKALFDFISRCIKKFMVMHKIGRDKNYDVGFTFSFPMKKQGIARGILIHWTKAFHAKGVEGKDVVKLLNESMRKNGIFNAKIVAIVNDTVATLVARSYEDAHCDVGVILGTGTNACYYERRLTDRVGLLAAKTANRPTRSVRRSVPGAIVNIEWGNFDKVRLTGYDRKLDGDSRNTGRQLLEKMVSGMYLGKIAGLILRDMGYSVIPEDFKSEYLSEIENDNTKNLAKINVLLKKSGIRSSTYSERKFVRKVCALVSTRAARLAASAMASVVTKMDPRILREHTIAVDGALYEKHPGFRKQIRSALKEIFGKKEANIKLRLTKNASSRGAAVVAATVKNRKL